MTFARSILNASSSLYVFCGRSFAQYAVVDIKISKFRQKNINFIRFEFLDYGIGVTDTDKESIFERSHIPDKSKRGMGIGLSLVQKIIELYLCNQSITQEIAFRIMLGKIV